MTANAVKYVTISLLNQDNQNAILGQNETNIVLFIVNNIIIKTRLFIKSCIGQTSQMKDSKNLIFIS